MTKHFCDHCGKEVLLEDEIKLRRFRKGEISLCESCFSDDLILQNIRSKFIDTPDQIIRKV